MGEFLLRFEVKYFSLSTFQYRFRDHQSPKYLAGISRLIRIYLVKLCGLYYHVNQSK